MSYNSKYMVKLQILFVASLEEIKQFFLLNFFFFYFLGFSFGVSGFFASKVYLSMLFQESQKSILRSFKIYIDSYQKILHVQATRGPKALESYLFLPR